MPTFWSNGNIIHFAQNKNHIGIYPGEEAIIEFKDRLSTYKFNKGTIQIPHVAEIDYKLIQDIVRFNVERLNNKTPDRWSGYTQDWVELYERMQVVIENFSLTKEYKWGMDIYTFNGKNVLGWRGFKNFFSVWFYNGVFLKDPYKVLIAASEGKTKGLRQWRFTNKDSFDEKKLMEYIAESIQTIKDEKAITITKNSPIILRGFLKQELENNEDLKNAFESLTPGRQKEYIEYIEEAKQDKTKTSRLEKIKPMILNKIGLHDKYKK